MLLVALGACTNQLPDQMVTGVVIAVDGPSIAEVDQVTIRTNAGETLTLTVGRLELTGGGLPAVHLREHLQSGIPITAHFRGGVMYYYIDVAS